MRGGVGSEIDRYEETEVRLRDFSAAIDAMLADETLWAIPSLPDGTPDAAKLLPFIQELFRRVVGEAGRTGIPATWEFADIANMQQMLVIFKQQGASMSAHELKNGVRLCRESLEYMRLSMTVLEPSPVADLAMTIADAITWALRSARDWFRSDNKKAL